MGSEIRDLVPVKNDGMIVIHGGIMGGEEVNAVDARELHYALRVGRDFSNWIKDRIAQCDLVEGQDYTSFAKISERDIGATIRRDYWVSLDAAKHIAMLERNEAGRRVRAYFIEAEKELRQRQQFGGHAIPRTLSEALHFAANQARQIEAQAPMVEAFQGFLETGSTHPMGDVAKMLFDRGRIKTGQNRLFRFLREQGVLMHNNHPYQEYVDRGLFLLRAASIGRGKVVMQTRATAKGVDFIFRLFTESGAGTIERRQRDELDS